MAKAIGVFNGNWKGGRGRVKLDLTSPRDDVLFALQKYMNPEEYIKFFDAVYTKYRWSDTPRYERILRYMLERLNREEGES